jgi:hypothetical protein
MRGHERKDRDAEALQSGRACFTFAESVAPPGGRRPMRARSAGGLYDVAAMSEPRAIDGGPSKSSAGDPCRMQKTLEMLLDRYDPLPLECDGFSRVASYCLRANGVPHAVLCGAVTTPVGTVSPHCWIAVGEWTVDYRLRMWAGPGVPHGVFHPPGEVTYIGKEAVLPCTPALYYALAGAVPAVPR